jgi:REP element-mobilizing transposase RayT
MIIMQRSIARKLNRLPEYDYSLPGYYFVTICTQDKHEWFGEVKDESMLSNANGKIVEWQWMWLAKQYSYLELNEFIVMPNHVHGIIIIDPDPVGNGRDRSLQNTKSLSSLIGAFKTTSCKQIHKSGIPTFKWQKSFYDHIIRNDKSLFEIRQYIHYNPLKWHLERSLPSNLYM